SVRCSSRRCEANGCRVRAGAGESNEMVALQTEMLERPRMKHLAALPSTGPQHRPFEEIRTNVTSQQSTPKPTHSRYRSGHQCDAGCAGLRRWAPNRQADPFPVDTD